VTANSGPASNPQIGAIVLAAGRSTRMGVTKMTLPWGDTTVIGQVIRVLLDSGVPDILVVTGGAQSEVQQALQGYLCVRYTILNTSKGRCCPLSG
jgi:CTP:molybdopterin cytidylyltransferase MocA